jgi:hypothetical protein
VTTEEGVAWYFYSSLLFPDILVFQPLYLTLSAFLSLKPEVEGDYRREGFGHGVSFCTHPLLSPCTLPSALSYPLCPSILLSRLLYLTLSALLISGDGDGDRRQRLGIDFRLTSFSPSPPCSLPYLIVSAPLSFCTL